MTPLQVQAEGISKKRDDWNVHNELASPTERNANVGCISGDLDELDGALCDAIGLAHELGRLLEPIRLPLDAGVVSDGNTGADIIRSEMEERIRTLTKEMRKLGDYLNQVYNSIRL
jgi:hypothetical protein